MPMAIDRFRVGRVGLAQLLDHIVHLRSWTSARCAPWSAFRSARCTPSCSSQAPGTGPGRRPMVPGPASCLRHRNRRCQLSSTHCPTGSCYGVDAELLPLLHGRSRILVLQVATCRYRLITSIFHGVPSGRSHLPSAFLEKPFFTSSFSADIGRVLVPAQPKRLGYGSRILRDDVAPALGVFDQPLRSLRVVRLERLAVAQVQRELGQPRLHRLDKVLGVGAERRDVDRAQGPGAVDGLAHVLDNVDRQQQRPADVGGCRTEPLPC